MLSANLFQESMLSTSPKLNEFRSACLLAFYEYHQFPGQQAWMRMGTLTRMAYWIGLDRLDTPNRFLDREGINLNDLPDWKLVWWCIYRLDTYCNLSVGMPFMINEERTSTTLVRTRDEGTDYYHSILAEDLHLTSHLAQLWKLIPEITKYSSHSLLYNMHIITATTTRQVGRALQSQMITPRTDAEDRLTKLEGCMSALQLALPSNYLNPKRNAFLNETGSNHHARLITVFHLSMSRLLISLMRCLCPGMEDEWFLNWQQVLGNCQDIAALSEQWNNAFSLHVDPAISFIIFTSLVFLDLHRKSATDWASNVQFNMEHCETVLMLHLEQFAKIWALPRLLIRAYSPLSCLWIGFYTNARA